MVPEAGYELRPIAVEGLSRSNPLKAARAALQARRAPWARRGGSCATCAPTRCSAPAATSPARSGSRRWPGACRIVLAEADSHLGLTNRLLARWARRVCLAFPIDGRDGERYLVTGRPVPPPATDRAAARARFGLAPDDTCVLVFGGSLGARTINEAAVAGAGRRRLPRPARLRARATTRRCARGSAPIRRPTTTCASSSPRSARRCWPATCASRAPAARSSRSPRMGARRSSCPIPTRRPTTRAPTRAGWPQAGAAVVVADAELTPERLAERGAARCWATARGWQAMGRASASLARPDAAQRIAEEVLRRGALSGSRRRRAR